MENFDCKKRDCFAWNRRECKCLSMQELTPEYIKKCAFYKTKEQAKSDGAVRALTAQHRDPELYEAYRKGSQKGLKALLNRRKLKGKGECHEQKR